MGNDSMKKKKSGRACRMRVVLGAVITAVLILTGVVHGAEVQAAEVSTCTTYTGDNIEDQNYTTYASPIKSYLVYLEDGTYMRVQAGSSLEGYLVEYYDEDFTITGRKMIALSYGNFFLSTGTSIKPNFLYKCIACSHFVFVTMTIFSTHFSLA